MSMRITTQMLNETAKRTGIPVNQSSLLDYISDDSSNGNGSGNTLLDALNKKTPVSSTAAENYKKLEKSAESLKEQSGKLTAKDADGKSFFDKIKESGNSEELYKVVESYVGSYNATLSDLKKPGNVLNQYYGEMLGEAARDNAEALAKIGITAGKDGALSIDKEKLKAASVEDIQAVFGPSGDLTSKTAFLADKIANHAQANVQSVSSQYDGAGNIYSQFMGKYDFWG